VDGGAEGAFKVAAGAGHTAVYADAFTRHAGDDDTPLGRQFNTFVDSEGFAFGTSLNGKEGFIGIAFSRFMSVYGIPVWHSRARRRWSTARISTSSRTSCRPAGNGASATPD
jgi:hypothetical protein